MRIVRLSKNLARQRELGDAVCSGVGDWAGGRAGQMGSAWWMRRIARCPETDLRAAPASHTESTLSSTASTRWARIFSLPGCLPYARAAIGRSARVGPHPVWQLRCLHRILERLGLRLVEVEEGMAAHRIAAV
eukprot:6209008-Pleurochrysis_carterae.AAC.3